ncbi:hypothetical protein [Nonomuraea jiangxiensis]|uniref:Uncharacterized protein n=1 Tax=Nonomuraea jiangxiensis TaxID=633440 RepID=A0A1G8XUG8_9ACTN|nr:hypothetical protein [Nonomuraea jiangxiensis]SDJ93430.1 hypothetical protein SAMN05421869_11360 [Nonomuraea jiangxiensis]
MSCRYPWCVRERTDIEPDSTTHISEPVEIGDLKVYTVVFGDGPDVVGLAELRYTNPNLSIDLTSTSADTMARILDRIEGEHAARVAAALHTAADTLDQAQGEDA